MEPRGHRRASILVVVLLLVHGGVAVAADPEVEELRDAVRAMQQTIEKLNQKIDRLEREKTQKDEPLSPVAKPVAKPAIPAVVAAPAPGAAPATVPPTEQAQAPAEAPLAPGEVATAPPPPPTADEAAEGYAENVLTSQGVGPQAPIDPKLRGFIRIPNTKAMIRFNAKPRVDFTYDTKNAGDDNRFVTAKIPVTGAPNEGGGPIFNANGKGSQLIIDVRAPEMAGSPRFYYQNDFYGSGSAEFNYRVQHLYGSIYGVTIGQTFSPFEDPDIWPDTVDYEGPNSMIFARFPLVRYKLGLADWLSLNPGISQADTQVSSVEGDSVSGVNHAPDFAMNLRGESDDVGHFQAGTVLRYLGARSGSFGDATAFGWGINLSGSIDVPLPWSDTDTDLLQVQGTYGEGIGRYSNDAGFFNTDAAYTESGRLVPLPYYAAFIGYTHRWLPDWRSTASYGWVKVDGEGAQGPDAYHQTQYASANLIWQLRERLSVGVEALYGDNQKQSGASGDVFRTQVGVAYSLF